MPTADERMMTSDPSPGKPGWMPRSRGRYPTVKIKKGWEPRGGNVGMGQSVGVGGPLPLPILPPGTAQQMGNTPPMNNDPRYDVPARPASPYGPTPPLGQAPGSSTGGGTSRPTVPAYAGDTSGGGPGQVSAQGVNAPPAGPSRMPTDNAAYNGPQGGGGGGAAQQGGGGGAQAARGPTPQEMEAVARYAASQWGSSFEDAMAEFMSGEPNAQKYLQAALGMLRAGQPEILAFMGGGQQDQAQAQIPPEGGATPPPTGSTPPPSGAGAPSGESQFDKDVRFRDFYQQNAVMHAAQGLSKQYGAPSDAIDMGDGTTTVKFAGGHSIRMNPDGTIFNGAAPGASPAGGSQNGADNGGGGQSNVSRGALGNRIGGGQSVGAGQGRWSAPRGR